MHQTIPRRTRANTGLTAPPPSFSKFVPTYSHATTYRSAQLEVQLSSPLIKIDAIGRRSVPVFGEHDQISGKISLDTSSYHTGRLMISIEGVFSHRLPSGPTSRAVPEHPKRHVFHSATKVIAISSPESAQRSVFRREGLLRRRPSASSLSDAANVPERWYPFSFDLPRGSRPGEELPATFLSMHDPSSPDYLDVTYKILADWEPADPAEVSSHLEIPFSIQPDDFQSADAYGSSDKSWLEMPLKSDRPLPLRCAMTLPTSATFSRSSSIPYFVVFTTTPRSPELAREIAADATISVSLVRQITVNESVSLPPTPPLTPTSEDSDGPGSARPKILRLVPKASAALLSRPRRPSETSISHRQDKSLPETPLASQVILTDSRTIHHDMSLGFPKRPRQQYDNNRNHPSLETIAALPDGLHKTRIHLEANLLPSLSWRGVTVKYYLDVAVLLGPDDFRARIPIRIV